MIETEISKGAAKGSATLAGGRLEAPAAATNGHAKTVAAPANGHVKAPAAAATNGHAKPAAAPANGAAKALAEAPSPVRDVAARTAVQPAATAQQSPEPEKRAAQPIHPPPRRSRKKWAALFFIGVPVLLSSIYFGFIASDQYVAQTDFSVSSPESFSFTSSSGSSSKAGGISMGSGSGGGGTMQTLADMYIVQDYIGSLQMIKDLAPYVDLRKMYSNPKADWWTRLDPNVPDEMLLQYWQSVTTVNFDMSTGLTTFTVHAFTPEDAKTIADRVLLLSEGLVNRLSERARNDSLALAKSEVTTSYNRAIKAREALEAYSRSTQQIDPQGMIKNISEIQAALASDLVVSQSELDLLRKNLPENAPGIVQLKDHIAVDASQLSAEKLSATSAQDGASANEIRSTFAQLNMENDFAAQAYTSALAALESAQMQAIGQSCYLEPVVSPQLPEYSLYPARLRSVLLTAIISILVFAIGSLLYAAIREHV